MTTTQNQAAIAALNAARQHIQGEALPTKAQALDIINRALGLAALQAAPAQGDTPEAWLHSIDKCITKLETFWMKGRGCVEDLKEVRAHIAQRAASADEVAGAWQGSIQQIICDLPIPDERHARRQGFVDCKMAILDAIRPPALTASTADALAGHADDAAVDRFAVALKAKMAAARAKGRSGWSDPAQCPVERLQAMLRDHIAKGDPVDVGNFAMMLFNRGERAAAGHASLGPSLLRPAISATNPLPPGCYCPPGNCQAPRIMGQQTQCRRATPVAAEPAPAVPAGSKAAVLIPFVDDVLSRGGPSDE